LLKNPRDHSSKDREVDSLVELAASGDAEAFGRLYDLYADRIYRHIYYRTNNVDDARDMTQEVFTRAWRKLPAYKRTGTPFLGWLFTISHNRVIDYYRTRKDQVYLNAEIDREGQGNSSEQMAEAEFTQDEVRRVIRQLPGDQQQVILMSFIEGLEYSEIASALHKTEGNIRVILHRGLKKMREIMGREER
jgi:RNA polymerase sigma-70 factor, ECF subfamily